VPKVKIFIDFWNFQICWNEYHTSVGTTGRVKIPWGNVLTNALLKKINIPNGYGGTHIYTSINPSNPHDRALKGFLISGLNILPGYKVDIKERKPAKPIKCNNDGCRQEIVICPHCHKPLIRTVEKGVDTMIATELIQFGIENIYDKAILISGDEDLTPAIDYIQTKGKEIINAGWQNQANKIRQSCFDHIFINDLLPDLLPTS
jgi:hypothetical protein